MGPGGWYDYKVTRKVRKYHTPYVGGIEAGQHQHSTREDVWCLPVHKYEQFVITFVKKRFGTRNNNICDRRVEARRHII